MNITPYFILPPAYSTCRLMGLVGRRKRGDAGVCECAREDECVGAMY